MRSSSAQVNGQLSLPAASRTTDSGGAQRKPATTGDGGNTPERFAGSAPDSEPKAMAILPTAAATIADRARTSPRAGPNLRTLLTLSATTEPAAVQRAMRLFAEFRPDACVLTKLDEAASLGSLLSALIQAGLATAFITDGQRVPEDLQTAKAHPLVSRAAELLAENPNQPDPGYLALAFGGVNAHVNG